MEQQNISVKLMTFCTTYMMVLPIFLVFHIVSDLTFFLTMKTERYNGYLNFVVPVDDVRYNTICSILVYVGLHMLFLFLLTIASWMSRCMRY